MPSLPADEEGNNMPESSDIDLAAVLKRLADQEQRILELERRWEQAQVASVPGPNSAEGNFEKPCDVQILAAEDQQADADVDPDVATYEFDTSMWDAALLIFVGHSTAMDKIVLFLGCATNLALQVALLCTVFLNMLENDFTDETVQGMLAWRTKVGHHETEFDDNTGDSLITKLCSRSDWSFEQDQYKQMHDYLYKPMPGVVLSALAIVLWVLTVMVEYRRCVEQSLAVIQLPARGSKEFMATEQGTMKLQGIRPAQRIFALTFLTLPRLAVMFFLAITGCQYLAQTVNLSDIVLNAVALAFVLDVDELVADVFLTENLRSLLSKVEPLSCGKPHRWFPAKDIIRYVITAGLVITSLFVWLSPFNLSVQAAAMALCSGHQDFSFEGGTVAEPALILQPKSFGSDPWAASCNGLAEDWYLKTYYGAEFNVSNSLATRASSLESKRKDHILNFAFGPFSVGTVAACGPGKVLRPQAADGARQCVDVPEALKKNLPSSVKPGEVAAPPSCPRFEAANGCGQVTLPEVCLWTWLSKKCDLKPPGQVYTEACDVSTPLDVSCRLWQNVFNQSHPTFNCIATEHCSRPWSCLTMIGALRIGLNDTSQLARAYGYGSDYASALGEPFVKALPVLGVSKFGITDPGSNFMDLPGDDEAQGYVEFRFAIENIAYTVSPLHEELGTSSFARLMTDFSDKPLNFTSAKLVSYEYMSATVFAERFPQSR
ncbi:unnamed protein product [Effrenium voratum]|uniref:Uncharacterized protein n=1 Tax=Effrenium voratum TaxID=2562239 RepID=A0AA36MJ84_9DINO|nr:unnamed protein product [Effrenium voratum]CAJ1370305.1 unnamed protein product [Effrenium voratum]CAJ1462371.1 unnamed protein product [Effrenium voratum]